MTGRKERGRQFNRAETAGYFGVSLPTLDDWVRRGCPVVERGSRGRSWVFNTADIYRWREQAIRAEAASREPASETELRLRRAVADTEMAELALAKARGEVAPIEQAERAMAEAFAGVRAAMRTVAPTRIARRVAGEKDETRIKAVILEEIDHALESLADADLVEEEALEMRGDE